MPPVRYKILVNKGVFHENISFSEAIDYMLMYINKYDEVTIQKYYP